MVASTTAVPDAVFETCSCKGVRFCKQCENSDRVRRLNLSEFDLSDKIQYVYCPCCRKGFQVKSAHELTVLDIVKLTDDCSDHLNCNVVESPGLLLIENFLSDDDECRLVNVMDETTLDWKSSQSGRRKQEWGPKVNFKARKVRLVGFEGMPDFSHALIKRMNGYSQLTNYIPLEVCNLEYEPSRGSGIDFHIDDTWIWGNRLISISLLSECVITLYSQELNTVLFVPLKRRSLLCMADEIRYQWKHAVLRHHVISRRIALTMREPEKKFLPGGELYESIGYEMLKISAQSVKTAITIVP